MNERILHLFDSVAIPPAPTRLATFDVRCQQCHHVIENTMLHYAFNPRCQRLAAHALQQPTYRGLVRA